ncbi:DUF397 domain-containing protein [Actinomadura physcomitrii]|uniref:DUF397 domain-containing protein n=1 Tax=Actinomadura physcomitrii TaxID=2650748 RepID=UPI0019216A14
MRASSIVWRKSSRSTAQADNCIEVASMPRSELAWRKTRRSNESGDNCVEVADGTGVVAVRDSKDPDGPMLVLNRDEFRHLAETLKNV